MNSLNESQRKLIVAGVIQNFEFTYELSWKFIKAPAARSEVLNIKSTLQPAFAPRDEELDPEENLNQC